ncbi:MAG: 50S ribosomal protein L9 [Bacteroidales bacterium]|jgi:large subunit ribosomal protein L9|nr:50S ribosomal protein L9 [Bacteroidales bacterium]
MEVILKQDVNGVGDKNDLITVKNGFGRNYLIPKGLAVLADKSGKKALAELKKQQAFKVEKILKEVGSVAEVLEGLELTIGTKAAANGKIFGSVNTIIIANAIKEAKNIEIDRKKIMLDDDHIKEVGVYTAIVKLHKGVQVEIKLNVVAE